MRFPMKSVLALLAAAGVVYGVWQIYAPASWIVAGALVLADLYDFTPTRRAP